MKRSLILFTVFSAFIIGCSSGPNLSTLGKQTVVTTSGSREDWVTSDQNYWVDEMYMNFRVQITNQYDIAAGRRNSKAEAVKYIAEMINQRIRTDYYSSSSGNNQSEDQLGRDVQDLITWTTDNLEISGISPDRTYWEKVETNTADGVKYSYDIHELYKIKSDDYRKAVTKASELAVEKAQKSKDLEAQKRAEKFQKKLYESN